MGRNSDLDAEEQELDDRDVELLNKIIRFIVQTKVDSMLSFMMNSYNEDLSQEALELIKEEILVNSEEIVRMLLQCACMADDA
jgi:hypothetical protein